jgi:hypothetical protein
MHCLVALASLLLAAPITHVVPTTHLSISTAIDGHSLTLAQTTTSQGAGFVAHTRVESATIDVSSPKLEVARAAGLMAALLALGGQRDPKQLGALISAACKKKGAQCQVGTISGSLAGLRRGSFVSAFEQTNAALVGAGQAIASNALRDYASALQSLGMQIVSKIGIACLSSPLNDVHNPDCVVEDRANADDSVVDSVPACAANGNQQPCWRYQPNLQCPQVVNPIDGSITRGSITIDRDPMAIPPGTHLRVACATIAHTSH